MPVPKVLKWAFGLAVFGMIMKGVLCIKDYKGDKSQPKTSISRNIGDINLEERVKTNFESWLRENEYILTDYEIDLEGGKDIWARGGNDYLGYAFYSLDKGKNWEVQTIWSRRSYEIIYERKKYKIIGENSFLHIFHQRDKDGLV